MRNNSAWSPITDTFVIDTVAPLEPTLQALATNVTTPVVTGWVTLGAGEFFFGQFHFRHIVRSGTHCFGLHEHLFGQAYLFIRRRIGCTTRQSQNGQGCEKRSNTH